MTDKEHKVRTPLFPLYNEVRALMRIVAGIKKADVTHLIQTIWGQTGTPQRPVNWTDPDKWIDERLTGADVDLAHRIWDESKHVVNPRYIYGAYLFINTYSLMSITADGDYQIEDRGKGFLTDDEQVVKELDEAEGIIQLLTIMASKEKFKRGDLLPEWSSFLLEYSKFQKPSSQKNTLSRRLGNLVERGLLDRSGNTYVISEKGLQYLESVGPIEEDPKREVINTVKQFNADQRSVLKDMLATMHPYRFEHLIRDLLEAIGYEDVTVTKEAGDKGVDVIGTIQIGITSVREVVQVKRTPKASIGRPILDQLRGALPYHHAIRGTIITLGTVTKGAREAAIFPGAAPITLIDGEKLVDLLVEHEVGASVGGQTTIFPKSANPSCLSRCLIER